MAYVLFNGLVSNPCATIGGSCLCVAADIKHTTINICMCNHLKHTSGLITFNREATAVIKMLQEHCWLDLVSKSDPTMPSTAYRNSRICLSHNLLQIGLRRNPLKLNKSLLLWSQAECCLSLGTGDLDQAYSVFRDACEGPWARFSRLHMRALVCHNINASLVPMKKTGLLTISITLGGL